MDILRGFIRVIANFTLGICLGLALSLTIFFMTIGNRQRLFGWLDKAGTYQAVVDFASGRITADTSDANKAAVQSVLITAGKQVFTPDFLRPTAMAFFNGIYDWLEQGLSKPNFNIDLTAQKNAFADAVAAGVKEKVMTKPACPPKTAAPTQYEDLLTAACRPSTAQIDALIKQARSDIAGSKEFLGTPTITADSLTDKGSGKSTFENLSELPKSYRLARKLVYVFWAIVVADIVLLVLVIKDKRKVMRGFMWRGFFVGGGLLLTGLAVYHSATYFTSERLKFTGDQKDIYEKLSRPLIAVITQDFGRLSIYFGAPIFFVGIVLAIVLLVTRQKSAAEPDIKPVKAKQPEPPVVDDVPPAPMQDVVAKPSYKTKSKR